MPIGRGTRAWLAVAIPDGAPKGVSCVSSGRAMRRLGT